MHSQQAAVIVNPVRVSLDRLRAAVAAQERRAGWSASRWYTTTREDPDLAVMGAALASDPDVVIVSGGDGTVRAAVEGIRGTGTPLALVPAGTGNLLARNLGLPLDDIERSVEIAFAGATRTIDVAVAELEDDAGRRSAHAFAVMAGIGIDADMAQHTSDRAKRQLGWMAYVAPIARSVIANRTFQADLRLDGGRARSLSAHTLIVGNCGTLTGNLRLIPGARLDDGLLDVVVLQPKGHLGWVSIGTRLALGGMAQRSRIGRRVLRMAPGLRALVYLRGRRIAARFASPHAVELDGDSFGVVVGIRIAVLPGALSVCDGGIRDEP